MNKLDFSRSEYQYLIEECCFTDEELAVLGLRRKGKSIIAISLELNISESTVSRRIKSICRKISKAI